MIFKIVYKLGAYFTNPNLFRMLKDMEGSDFSSRDNVQHIQKNKIFKLLSFVKLNSIYYSNKINNCDRLYEVDVISKNEIIQNRDSLVTCYHKKVKWVETSGTSGEALCFPKSVDWDTINRAVMFKYYSWYGVKPWDRNGYFWGFNNKGIRKYRTYFLDLLQNRFRLFSYEKNEVEKFLKKLKGAVFLHGYSSMIYETAKLAIELGYTPSHFPKLKMIKGTSEKIYPYYQEVVIKAFGKKIISEYGAAETGIIAFECPDGNMHINDENVFVEVDENNEIIVTNLNSFSFPIVRYKLGDYVETSSYEKCGCGRKSDIIDEIKGRVGKKIFGKNTLYPSLTLYYIFKNLALNYNIELQYQGFQKEIGKLDLRFSIKIKKELHSLILKECYNYFKNDLEVTIVSNYILNNKKSKLKDFITELK